jgi:hypothetical protein
MSTTSDPNHGVEIRSIDVSFSTLRLEMPILNEGNELADRHFKGDVSIGILLV